MEQDPMELWNSVEECIDVVSQQLKESAIKISDIKVKSALFYHVFYFKFSVVNLRM